MTTWTNLEKLIFANRVFDKYVANGRKPVIGVRVLANAFIDGDIGVTRDYIDRFGLYLAAKDYKVNNQKINYYDLASIMNEEIKNLYKERMEKINKDLKSINNKLDNRFRSDRQVKSSPKMKVTVTVTYEL